MKLIQQHKISAFVLKSCKLLQAGFVMPHININVGEQAELFLGATDAECSMLLSKLRFHHAIPYLFMSHLSPLFRSPAAYKYIYQIPHKTVKLRIFI